MHLVSFTFMTWKYIKLYELKYELWSATMPRRLRSAPKTNCKNWSSKKCLYPKLPKLTELYCNQVWNKLCHFLRSNPRFLRNEVDRKLFEPLKLKLMKNQFSPLAFQPMVVIFLLWKQFGLILVVVIPWSQKGLLSPTWSFFIG